MRNIPLDYKGISFVQRLQPLLTLIRNRVRPPSLRDPLFVTPYLIFRKRTLMNLPYRVQ